MSASGKYLSVWAVRAWQRLQYSTGVLIARAVHIHRYWKTRIAGSKYEVQWLHHIQAKSDYLLMCSSSG